MAKCRNCGKEIAPDVTECPYCGEKNPFGREKQGSYSKPGKGSYYHTNDFDTSNNKIYEYKEPNPEPEVCISPKKNYNPPTREEPLDKISGMAIAGFVTSFFVPFIGLPFSLTAYYRCETDKYLTNIRYSIAGIVISLIMIVAWIIGIIVLIAI